MVDLTNLKVGDIVMSRNGGVLSVEPDFYFDGKWVFIHGVYFDVITGRVGRATGDSPFDIISITPKPEPKRIKGWVNIYESKAEDGVYFTTDRIMDCKRNDYVGLVACIEIDVAEGEGL